MNRKELTTRLILYALLLSTTFGIVYCGLKYLGPSPSLTGVIITTSAAITIMYIGIIKISNRNT